MFRLLLPVFLVLGLFLYWKILKNTTPEDRVRKLKGIGAIAAMVAAGAFAVRTGSLGWAAGGLLAIIAMRAIPYLNKHSLPASDGAAPDGGAMPTSGGMTRAEALRILDLSEPFTSQDVQSRYRELMRGVHPDRGGSTHLAAQVNAAYRVLKNAQNGKKRT